MKRIFLCLMVLEFGAVAWSAGADTAPNFVVIMAEAQGWPNTSVRMDDRLPASKSAVFKTPAVERLAREGMRFAYGYALSPRCTPSRAALFTGIGPAALGMTYVGVGRESGPVRTALIPPAENGQYCDQLIAGERRHLSPPAVALHGSPAPDLDPNVPVKALGPN